MNSQIKRSIGLPSRFLLFNRRFKKVLAAALLLLALSELPVALPCVAQSQASSEAGSEAGTEAPGFIGRRRGRRGGRGYWNQINQANRMAAQQEMQRAKQLTRQQQSDDQVQLRREQNLARSNDGAFVKEYGSRQGSGMRKGRKLGGISNAANSPAPTSGTNRQNLSAATPSPNSSTPSLSSSKAVLPPSAPAGGSTASQAKPISSPSRSAAPVSGQSKSK